MQSGVIAVSGVVARVLLDKLQRKEARVAFVPLKRRTSTSRRWWAWPDLAQPATVRTEMADPRLRCTSTGAR
jgi:hypothetical protein